MSDEPSSDEIPTNLRASWSLVCHIAALALGGLCFAATIFTGWSSLLFPAGVGFVASGICAVIARESVLRLRGHALVEEFAEGERARQMLAELTSVVMGVLLSVFGVGVVVMAVWVRVSSPR